MIYFSVTQLVLSGGPQSEQVGLAKYLLNSKLESKQAQQATYDTNIKANSNSSDLQFKQTLKDKTANHYKDLIKLVKHYALFSINQLAFYHECCSLIGYATHWLFTIYMGKPVGRWFVQMESKIPSWKFRLG